MSGEAESSRQSAKRSKKQMKAARVAAIVAARQKRNTPLRLSDGGSTNSPRRMSPNRVLNNPGDQADLNPENSKRKPRGKAKMLDISKGKGKGPLEIEFNSKGQPYGKNAAKFSSFLGISARELVPVTVESWKVLAPEFKRQIWEHVTQNFKVNDCHKKYCFRKMSKLWRDWRCNLMKDVRKQAEIVGLPRASALLKPTNVESMTDWQTFIKSRNTSTFRKQCEKFREMRKQQTLKHRTSRKSFARVEDELRQQSENPDAISRTDVWIHAYEAKKNGSDEEVEDPEIVKQVKRYRAEEEPSQINSIQNDAVAKVLGPDPRGRVRGFGFGAIPSKVDGQIHMDNKVSRLENDVANLKNTIAELIIRLEKGGNSNDNTSVQNSANEVVQSKRKENPSLLDSGNDIARSKKSQQKKSTSNQQSINERAQSKQIEGAGAQSSDHLNKMCKLLSWAAKEEVVVALGEIASTDPYTNVHHVPLGHDCWKVWVREVIENMALYRPTSEFCRLADAEESTIAWPIKYIKLD